MTDLLGITDEGPECFAFQWIGQSFASCDNCGKPYWEHTHVAGPRPGGSPFDGRTFHRLIPKAEAEWVRAKWGAAS